MERERISDAEGRDGSDGEGKGCHRWEGKDSTYHRLNSCMSMVPLPSLSNWCIASASEVWKGRKKGMKKKDEKRGGVYC